LATDNILTPSRHSIGSSQCVTAWLGYLGLHASVQAGHTRPEGLPGGWNYSLGHLCSPFPSVKGTGDGKLRVVYAGTVKGKTQSGPAA
jgi:hypothetical protein